MKDLTNQASFKVAGPTKTFWFDLGGPIGPHRSGVADLDLSFMAVDAGAAALQLAEYCPFSSLGEWSQMGVEWSGVPN